ncbi:MAG: SDR family oxidoreductase [Zymomonas mobilis subsp. pomaceae]|uniref:Short-chain dehydrogenase/reductase SDR n=1 Tax=Zymomonas mobilis subsp. pomaceae (strain ATCC 29192 / DSM 22645 / JCM 10191 / CCUG 17912 / NBRC 13757 / NCIMB 11200 / NRRL B-4491 / Barker I) TaxID=579138 RepID=F8ET22_ZYMMT|nr:SDR family oxidoreductase [Zymomonas mobilis]AEI37926.1 short-chain dehydrogenase/reductase SDR [Zymomonas mobilis subsp. pomaceae ATCC 29192]MDX5949295.1 SDR family oxidoreductase [Zymomonas mobilis subsp. pomaceae]GEB89698.1 short-chain dehydrogenase/reductase [Zymomonas mobilis subsp. pomaceae]
MTNRVAIITGGSRGIGAAIAEKLAMDGFDIAFSYARSASQADVLREKIEKLGQKALAIQADGSTVEGNKKVIAETIKYFGRLDVLVCNAGMYPYKTIDQVTVEDIDQTLNLNLRAVMVETAEAVQHMSAGGRIILIGSVFAERAPFPGISLYASTKAALKGFAKGAARDLGSKAITINVIEPGPIDTDMNPVNGEAAHLISSFVATKHYGKVNDIARTASFLASPDAGYITGTAIPVDGGLLA